MPTTYQILQWRKRLERRGWYNGNRFSPPKHEIIEYHAVWKGRIYSGRCRLADYNHSDWWRPGTHAYLLLRRHDVSEVVWRKVGRRLTLVSGPVC